LSPASTAAGSAGQRVAGGEPHEGLAGHQRVVGEAGVRAGVRDDERVGLEDRMAAEGDFAAGLVGGQAALRLEPLPVGVEQGEVGDRHVEDRHRQPDDPIEAFFGRRVEQFEGVQVGEPFGLVGGQRRGDHDQPSACGRAARGQ
jgi:hypothetical protein